MVRFRDGKPTGIYFSQHSDGAAYKWSDAALSMEDERVSLLQCIYVAVCMPINSEIS